MFGVGERVPNGFTKASKNLHQSLLNLHELCEMKTYRQDQIHIINELPPVAKRGDKVAIDTEWTGMDKKKLHRPTGEFASLACTFDGKVVYLIQDKSKVGDFLRNLDSAVWIFHNAKFDIFHLRRITPISKRMNLWDTMLVEQIMYSGYYNDFTLADLARRRLGIYLPKEERETFSDSSDTLTQSQLFYSASDVVATWEVYASQKSEIDEDDLNIWRNIELPFLWVVLAFSGMKLDADAWEILAKDNQRRAQEYRDKYPKINLNSPKQVMEYLKKLGYKKLEKTKEDFLKPIMSECEFARDLVEYRGLSKASSTYGENWLKDFVESNGRVYSDFRTIGAATGRLSSSNPNVENIPSKDTKKFRECIIAEEEHVIVDADWSAQEPRIAAYLSNDKKMIEIFQKKKDIYIEAAKLMFGWDLSKKDPRRGGRMKPTVLGSIFGLTEYGMELKYQVPKEEGKKLLQAFFETFDGMRQYRDRQRTMKKYVTTIYGRKFWLNSYQKGSENNALNSPVQGSAADAMKIATYRFLIRWGWSDVNSIMTNIIHDEILLEVPEELKDPAMQLLRDVMIEVAEEMHEGIPADVEVGYGRNWAEAHA